MGRKLLKKRALKAIGKIAYARVVGDTDTADMSERMLRNVCRRLAAFGTLSAAWWYDTFTKGVLS